MRALIGRGESLRKRMYAEIAEALAGGDRVFLLVPEQYTLEAELEAMERLSLRGSFQLQVISPARLFERLFEAAGRPEGARVDERGRVMLLASCLRRYDKELLWFRGALRKRGFAEKLAREIAACKQAGLTSGDLLDAASRAGMDSALGRKLTDTARIWASYERSLGGLFLDGEDERNRALERAGQAAFLAGARVWAQGFEFVSPALADTLVALSGPAKAVTVCLSGALPGDADWDSYRVVWESVDKLAVRAGGLEELRVPADAPKNDIDWLSRALCARSAAKRAGEPEGVELYALPAQEDEARFAAATARELVRTRGWRYRDVAIVSQRMPDYTDALRRACGMYDVPFFPEESRGALSHPAARVSTLALRLIARGYAPEDMRLYLRTGYTDLTDDECDIMENYLYECAPRGSMWKRPFTRGTDRQRALAEPLREKLAAPLWKLEAGLKEARDVTAQLTALWAFVEDMRVGEKLEAERDRLVGMGRLVEAAEGAQIFAQLIGAVEQMQALLGDARMSPRELGETLEASLQCASVKPLPQSGDAVCAVSMSRLRGRPFKALIVVGASDAPVPAAPSILTPDERRALEKDAGAWFPLDADGRQRLGALDMKNALQLTRDTLIVTYPLGAGGEGCTPGALIRHIRRACPDARLHGDAALARRLYTAPEAALLLAPSALPSGDPDARAALDTLSGTREYAERAASLVREKQNGRETLAPSLVRGLYDMPLALSVTALEKFAACPNAYFLSNGLNVRMPRPFGYDFTDRGELLHRILDRFFREARGCEPGEEAMARAEAIAREEARGELGARLSGETLSMLFEDALVRRARASADAALWQASLSRFRPKLEEVRFGELNPLLLAGEGDARVTLRGRIDRVDECGEGRTKLVRVVDYKASEHKIDFGLLYYGLQIQLPIYLAAACALYGALPAGAYYFPAGNGLADCELDDAEVALDTRRKKLSMNGMTCADWIDRLSENPKATIGVALKKDGGISERSACFTREQMDALLRFAVGKAAELAGGIQNGDVRRRPADGRGTEPSCLMCDYRPICAFDLRDPAADRRVLEKLDITDALCAMGVREKTPK